MDIKNNWKTALVASLIVAIVLSTIKYFLFTGGTIYVSQVEWDKVNAMPYREAQDYLAGHVENISNLQSVLNGTAYKEFWLRYIHDMFFYFLLAFASCLLFVKLKQYNKRLWRKSPD